MILKRCFLILALLVAFHALPFLTAQSSAQAPAATPGEHRKTSVPYTGDLSVFDSPGRDKRLQVDRVMDILGITQGKTVADIGAGSGWFTVRAARRVGDAGVVYAEDINPESIRYVDERAQKEHLSNVKTILGKPDDPMLPPGGVDAVLLLKTYHEVAEPVAFACGICSGRCAPVRELESSTATEMARIMVWAAMLSCVRPRRRATGCLNNMIL